MVISKKEKEKRKKKKRKRCNLTLGIWDGLFFLVLFLIRVNLQKCFGWFRSQLREGSVQGFRCILVLVGLKWVFQSVPTLLRFSFLCASQVLKLGNLGMYNTEY